MKTNKIKAQMHDQGPQIKPLEGEKKIYLLGYKDKNNLTNEVQVSKSEADSIERQIRKREMFIVYKDIADSVRIKSLNMDQLIWCAVGEVDPPEESNIILLDQKAPTLGVN